MQKGSICLVLFSIELKPIHFYPWQSSRPFPKHCSSFWFRYLTPVPPNISTLQIPFEHSFDPILYSLLSSKSWHKLAGSSFTLLCLICIQLRAFHWSVNQWNDIWLVSKSVTWHFIGCYDQLGPISRKKVLVGLLLIRD